MYFPYNLRKSWNFEQIQDHKKIYNHQNTIIGNYNLKYVIIKVKLSNLYQTQKDSNGKYTINI